VPPAGTTTATAAFAGDVNYQPSNTTTPFTITREQTTIAYNGDTVILNGNTLHASAVLTEDDSTPYPGRCCVVRTRGVDEPRSALKSDARGDFFKYCGDA
jgi:hypothetical protein